MMFSKKSALTWIKARGQLSGHVTGRTSREVYKRTIGRRRE